MDFQVSDDKGEFHPVCRQCFDIAIEDLIKDKPQPSPTPHLEKENGKWCLANLTPKRLFHVYLKEYGNDNGAKHAYMAGFFEALKASGYAAEVCSQEDYEKYMDARLAEQQRWEDKQKGIQTLSE